MNLDQRFGHPPIGSGWERVIVGIVVAAFLSLFALSARADSDCEQPDGVCPVELDSALAEPEHATEQFLFFWGVGCPHCEAAKPFVKSLPAEFPGLEVESIEVRQDPEGRRRFVQKVKELGIPTPGIPTFVFGQKYVVGFSPGVTEGQVRAMLRGDSQEDAVELPILGRTALADYSLPVVTVMIGLLDGINPCAMWVLLVLLGILMHVKSRSRLFLVGGLFVLMSGLVYFLFMTVWVELFQFAGLSRWVTLVLGAAVSVMGLVNLKELFWFKKGPSLTIPDHAKPALYRRMRGIANAASFPAAIVGISVLAFLVNLIELGCTIGLPAIYARLLSVQGDLSSAGRYAYLALYNLAYVVPLAVIVVVYAVTLQRLALSERGAKLLKLVSGVLLVSFGLVFLLRPELLA